MLDQLENLYDAQYQIAQAKYIQNYDTGDVIATVTDPDGDIIRAELLTTNLPSGMSLNSITGVITVDDHNALTEGITSGIKIKTTNSAGERTFHNIAVQVRGDVPPTVQQVTPIAILQDIPDTTGQTEEEKYVYVLPVDPDGLIVSASMTGNVPNGVSINTTSGKIFLDDKAAQVTQGGGIFIVNISLTDQHGGSHVEQNFQLVIPADGDHLYDSITAKNVDNYNTGEVLAHPVLSYGTLVSATTISTLPPGVTLNGTTGEVVVSDAGSLVAGTTNLSIVTTDNYGAETTTIVPVTFLPDSEATWTIGTVKAINYYQEDDVLGQVTDTDGSGALTFTNSSVNLLFTLGVTFNQSNQLVITDKTLFEDVVGETGNWNGSKFIYNFTVDTEDSEGGETIALSIQLEAFAEVELDTRYSYQIDTTTAKMDLGTSFSSYINVDKAFSAALLVHRGNGTGTEVLLSNKNNLGHGVSLEFDSSGKLVFELKNASGAQKATTSFSYSNLSWLHIVISSGGTPESMKIYVNNFNVPTTTSGNLTTNFSTNQNMILIADPTSTSKTFNGWIAYAAIYSTSFTSAGVGNLYDGGSFTVDPRNFPQCRGCYLFDTDTHSSTWTVFNEVSGPNGTLNLSSENKTTVMPATRLPVSSPRFVRAWMHPDGNTNLGAVNPMINQYGPGDNYSAILSGTVTSSWFENLLGTQGNNGLQFSASNSSFYKLSEYPEIEFQLGNPFSIAFWTKTTTATAKQVVFSTFDFNSGNHGYEVFLDAGKVYFRLKDFSGNELIVYTSAAHVNNSAGAFVTVTHDGSATPMGVIIYIEGTAVTTSFTGPAPSSLSGVLTPNSLGKYIGGDDSGIGYYNGSLGHLFIVEGVLTVTEMNDLQKIRKSIILP